MNNLVLGKTMENVWKTYRNKTFNNRKKKKIFGVRTRLLCYKGFHRTFVGYRNEKNSNTYE